jgi:outer membrane protein OmpA-like peptidoglycan-associated protein
MRPLVSLLIAVLVSTGCATKKYVVGQVGEVNNKVATLSTEIENTQQRSQRNEARIDEVNLSAQAAKAGVSEAKDSAAKAFSRAEEAERLAKGKLVYQVTLSNDKVTFPRNRAKLSDDAKKLVDETVGPVVAENRGAYLEIEGHTDSTGSASYNRRLGEDRALAVRNYLHDHYQIALNRMAVISYGGAKPVEDNKTRANRSMNRRVVISVLE